MSKRFSAALVTLLFSAGSTAFADDEAKPADGAKPKVNYARDVQPIFREHCYTCHNQEQKKSDLALDTYASTMKGGAGGEVVFAGDLDSSRLWALVAHIETPKMPPEQDKLVDTKLALIKQWILDGALENDGSKPVARAKPAIELKITGAPKRPSGPPPMPERLTREPFLYTPRSGAVTAIAASPWAPLIALSGQKQVLLYHAETGDLLGVLPFPEGSVQVLKFSRTGTILLAGGGRGGQSGRTVLYDVKTGNRLAEAGDEVDAVLAADISNDHSLVALGGPRKIVRVYDVENGTVEYDLKKHTDWIYTCEFSPNGELLATGDRSGGLFVWEAATGREVQNLTGHTGGVTDVSWRGDSKLLASSSEDGTVKIWEMQNGKAVKSWSAHSGGALAVEYTHDGRLISAGRDKETRLWDGEGKAVKAFGAAPDIAMEVALSHDGKQVVSGDLTGLVRLWNVEDGKLIANLAVNPPTLSLRVGLEKDNIARCEEAAKKAAAELAVAQQACDAQNKVIQAAVDSAKSSQAAAEKTVADRDAAKKAAADAGAALDAAKAKREKAKDEEKVALQGELDKARSAREAAEKRLAELTAQVKPTADKAAAEKSAAEKIAGTKGPLEKTLAEKAAASKAADEAVTKSQATYKAAVAEKEAFDAAQQTQKSAAR